MSLAETLLDAGVGDTIAVPVDLIITDDWTTPALLDPLEAMHVQRSAVPIVLVHDHTYDPSTYTGADRERVERNHAIMHRFVERYDARLIERSGIQHYAVAEAGLIEAGMIVLGNDSHTSTLGAFGAYAQAAQPTTIAAAMRTGTFPLTIPPITRIRLEGALRTDDGISVRDAAMTLLSRLEHEPVTGSIIEFCGSGAESLTMHERMILANIAPEAGARTAIFAADPDQRAMRSENAASHTVDFSFDDVRASIARSGSPSDAYDVASFPKTPIDSVFVGTCAGGTYDEIRAFAHAFGNGPLRTRATIVPASRSIAHRLAEEGILEKLVAEGIDVLEPGCGPCFGFGPGRLEPGEVGVSTGNRNAHGRMGRGSIVHLVSGYRAGIVAREGYLGDSAHQPDERERSVRIIYPNEGNVIIIDGDVTTDDITPSAVPGIGTSSDTDPNVLRQLLFANIDRSFASRSLEGRVLVTRGSFGLGSNRASAVRALRTAGIAGVVAPRIAPLYADGARDEGFAALRIDDQTFYEQLTVDSKVVVDLTNATITLDTNQYRIPMGSLEREILVAGGIAPYLAKEIHA